MRSRPPRITEYVTIITNQACTGTPKQEAPDARTPGLAPTTLRGALTAARHALAGRSAASLPDDELKQARRALNHAFDLLDQADREMGAFLDAEPYRLVLDPVPAGEPARDSSADSEAKLLA